MVGCGSWGVSSATTEGWDKEGGSYIWYDFLEERSHDRWCHDDLMSFVGEKSQLGRRGDDGFTYSMMIHLVLGAW